MSILSYRILVWNSLILFLPSSVHTHVVYAHMYFTWQEHASDLYWTTTTTTTRRTTGSFHIHIMISSWCHIYRCKMCVVEWVCVKGERSLLLLAWPVKRSLLSFSFTGQASKYSLTVHAKHLQSLPAVECLKLQCSALFEVYSWSPAWHHSQDEWSVHYCSSLPKWWEVPPSIHR